MPGPFATREAELRALRRRVPRYRVPFPDLSVEQRTSPCSNRLTNIVAASPASRSSGARQFPIGHNHKQGLELITPDMMKHLQWLGGKKS